jgi:hypothetical protein
MQIFNTGVEVKIEEICKYGDKEESTPLNIF